MDDTSFSSSREVSLDEAEQKKSPRRKSIVEGVQGFLKKKAWRMSSDFKSPSKATVFTDTPDDETEITTEIMTDMMGAGSFSEPILTVQMDDQMETTDYIYDMNNRRIVKAGSSKAVPPVVSLNNFTPIILGKPPLSVSKECADETEEPGNYRECVLSHWIANRPISEEQQPRTQQTTAVNDIHVNSHEDIGLESLTDVTRNRASATAVNEAVSEGTSVIDGATMKKDGQQNAERTKPAITFVTTGQDGKTKSGGINNSDNKDLTAYLDKLEFEISWGQAALCVEVSNLMFVPVEVGKENSITALSLAGAVLSAWATAVRKYCTSTFIGKQ